MALTKMGIELNFAEAKAQAAAIEDLAADLKKLAEHSMENSIEDMSAAWKGESASAYFCKAEALKGKISSTSKELTAIAGNIRSVAKQIYEAEMAALAVAQSSVGSVGGR